MKNIIISAVACAAGTLAATASADFFGQTPCEVTGMCFSTQLETVTWGSGAGQGSHFLNSSSTYWDDVYGSNDPLTLPVFVSSQINDQWSLSFDIDFTQFHAEDFQWMTIDISRLKTDGSLLGAQGNSTGFSTDGYIIHWEGTGAELAQLGVLSFKVYQVPTPGALALLGVGGLAAGRRRRA